jgi:tetratricopeptide (TPR) repeat protein
MSARFLLLTVALVLLLVAPAGAQDPDDLNAGDPAVRSLVDQGSRFVVQGDFKSAIAPYQEALNREKAKRTLGQTHWRVLVDNLGQAYGISGDLKKAKATLEYGISKDPKYPMFHYNLACTYAEMNDVDSAINSLRKAYENKQNMNKGDRFPNPWTDNSLKKLVDNDKFNNALMELTRN